MQQVLERHQRRPAIEDQEDLETLADPTNAQIADEISRWYHLKTKCDLELMKKVAEAEGLEIYREEGFSSTAEWLCTFLGIGYHSALKFTEVALSLEQLPLMRKAYEQSRISYDHLRAVVQVAGPENESDLLEAIEGLSVGDTFRLVAKILEVSKEDAVFTRSGRQLQMRWDHEQRMLILWALLPEEQGKMVEKAIDALALKMPMDSEPDSPFADELGASSMGIRRADALVAMASAALATHPSKPQVVVHVDAAALSEDKGVAGIEDGPAISLETARRLSCDSSIQLVTDGRDGKPISAGRSRRTVAPRMLRELRRRDGTCRFPGCRRRKGLHAHHIVHWAKGGPTDYDNLLLLCETHHFLVHEAGFEIKGEPPKVWVDRPGREPLRVGPPPGADEVASSFEWELTLSRASPRAPGN